MGWYPHAIRREIARHRTPMERYRAIVLHVTAVDTPSQYAYFNRPGNSTSHFHVAKDGTIEQYVDTRFQAPAQLEGNDSCIGIETQGLGPGEWTPAQMDALVALCVWAHEAHGIPLEEMPDSRPVSRGIAPHRWGVPPWKVSDGELWTVLPQGYGKSCPGNDRMRQWPEVVIRAQEEVVALSDDDKAWIQRLIVSALANAAPSIVRALLDGSSLNTVYVNPNVEPLKSLVEQYSLKQVKAVAGGGAPGEHSHEGTVVVN